MCKYIYEKYGRDIDVTKGKEREGKNGLSFLQKRAQ